LKTQRSGKITYHLQPTHPRYCLLYNVGASGMHNSFVPDPLSLQYNHGNVHEPHVCTALPCITMCSLSYVAGHTNLGCPMLHHLHDLRTTCVHHSCDQAPHHKAYEQMEGNLHIFLGGKVQDTPHEVSSPSVPS